MKIVVSIYFTILLTVGCTVRNKNIQISDTKTYNIAIESQIVKVDNLNRIYVVNDKNVVVNYSPENKELYRYANNRSGKISTVDVSNPLRVVLFYDDFNHVKVLDNTLSVISELSLSEMYSDITACSSTNDGHLWIYDPIQFRLLKIRDNGDILVESSNVNDFGMNNVVISEIMEKNNTVVLCDKNKGFYIFDNLGQYQYHYNVGGIKNMVFDGRQVIYYTEKEGLKSFVLRTKKENDVPNPLKLLPQTQDLKYIIFHEGRYYYVYTHGIDLYEEEVMGH